MILLMSLLIATLFIYHPYVSAKRGDSPGKRGLFSSRSIPSAVPTHNEKEIAHVESHAMKETARTKRAITMLDSAAQWLMNVLSVNQTATNTRIKQQLKSAMMQENTYMTKQRLQHDIIPEQNRYPTAVGNNNVFFCNGHSCRKRKFLAHAHLPASICKAMH